MRCRRHRYPEHRHNAPPSNREGSVVLIDVAATPPRQRLDVDVCIVGAGPAGISIAAELANGRCSVGLLEAGSLELDPMAQLLNLGHASGPMVHHDPLYLATSRIRLFGGSQHGWGGWCTPMLPADLEVRDWVEHSGWPISMTELVPYYERAARVCGLHESTAHPVPETLIAGGELTERRYVFAPKRRTARDVFQQKLSEAPNVSVYLGANVTTICESGRPARPLQLCASTRDGSMLAVAARYLVLAAGGVENARLLLANRLASGNAMVGRFFMEHPHVLVGSVELPDRSRWTRYMEHIDPALGHGAMWALALPMETQRRHRLLNATVQLWPDGGTLHDRERDDVLRARLLVRTEQSPNPESRVTLGAEVDRLGVPVTRLHWELQRIDWESVCTTAELVGAALTRHFDARVHLTVSPQQPWPVLPRNADNYHPWGCHHIGTTKMSDDGQCGVTDTHGQVHGTDNVFVAGSSLFPTSGYANPTFTLVALALRTADRLKHIL
jgi:choline dehydrogenase-like flavoprotein